MFKSMLPLGIAPARGTPQGDNLLTFFSVKFHCPIETATWCFAKGGAERSLKYNYIQPMTSPKHTDSGIIVGPFAEA